MELPINPMQWSDINKNNPILDTVANKAIDANKEQDTIVDKKLNTIADKAVDINKRRDAFAELLILIKN